MHDTLKVFLGEQLVQTAEIKGTIGTHHAFEKNLLHSLLLNQQLVKAEKSHDVTDKDLLGWVPFILKNNCLKQVKQHEASLALDLFSEEIQLFL